MHISFKKIQASFNYSVEILEKIMNEVEACREMTQQSARA
jgi:hypothetical protein